MAPACQSHTAQTFAGGERRMMRQNQKADPRHPDTGLTNMFDTNMVQRLAYERDFYELVVFIEEHRKEYVHFILYGEA